MTTNSIETRRSDSYQDYLIEALADREHAAAYLTAHLEEVDPEPELLQLALSNVAEAIAAGQMSPDSARESLQQLRAILSKPGSIAIYELARWLEGLGLKLTVTTEELKTNNDRQEC